MVWVAPGVGQMGSKRGYREEYPVKDVTTSGFWIDAHEITNAQFEAFVDATRYITNAERAAELGFPDNGSYVFAFDRTGSWRFVKGANWRHPEGPGSTIEGRPNDPVVQVSLADARAYAKWVGRDLPTEAQWEYAARGGTGPSEFPWGDELQPADQFMANTWQGFFPFSNTGEDGFYKRAPVGCFAANGYGLYDMIGNVWELTQSAYYGDHSEAALIDDKPGHDARQPGVPVAVIKGGSFLCAENFCRRYRASARQPQDTALGTNHIGFRTVLRADAPTDNVPR